MVLSSEGIENVLLEVISTRDTTRFHKILSENKVDLNTPRNCLGNLSIFEKVLQTSNSGKLIELCLKNGSSFYQRNNNGLYPLRYAITSLCAENLQTLVTSAKQIDSHQIDILFSVIVNEKLDAGNNYLNYLVEHMTKENFSEVSEMIKVLVTNKCSPNSPNQKSDTPFSSLLKKLGNISIKNDLVEFFILNAEIDFDALNQNDVAACMKEFAPTRKIPAHKQTTRDFVCMNHLLEQWQEMKFVDEFERYESQSISKAERNLSGLLETAVARNMREIVALLLTNGADVDGIPKGSKMGLPAAFVACQFGYHEMLQDLLKHSPLSFKSSAMKRNLLHQVCLESSASMTDRVKCCYILLADRRCTNEIVNGEDGKGFVPLYYAVQNGFERIATNLLRRGASLDHPSIINHISKEEQRKLLRQYTNSYLAKDCSDDDADDSKVSLILGDFESDDLESDNKQEKFRKVEKLAWFIAVAFVCVFIIFSIVGISRNIREGLGDYNESDVLQSGFKLKARVIQTLVGGGKVKDPSLAT